MAWTRLTDRETDYARYILDNWDGEQKPAPCLAVAAQIDRVAASEALAQQLGAWGHAASLSMGHATAPRPPWRSLWARNSSGIRRQWRNQCVGVKPTRRGPAARALQLPRERRCP